ncbi:HlyC/CorC family transporter [Paenibacillus nanensis]|uniref:HlyC/CorC family transporter n=1 Tax=Paenibacillus nanensis TaxID=393251 RepID=A0A3A1UQU5_9BACL|nr:hemolysin family protein [Paenibacillus nanensis]RIX50625.1 HlyC/CorC family transporter [Paenibacillus nanensis]
MGDPLPLSLSLALVLLLIGVNGFLVAAQYALSTARIYRFEQMTKEGGVRARRARRILDRLNLYMTLCQLGVTISSVGLGWLAARLTESAGLAESLARAFPELTSSTSIFAFLLVFVPTVMLHLLVGELLPRSIVKRRAERTALAAAKPLHILYLLASPVIWLIELIASKLQRFFGVVPDTAKETAHTEEDLRDLLKESHRNGHIDQTELTLVDNIFDFAETTAKEIMIPRTEMICLHAQLSLEANKAIAIQYMRTRYPVCETDKDNIIGFVHMKDLLKSSAGTEESILELIRPITSVPDSIPISALLKLMQKKKSQIAILIDEYGGTSGLVTLEDIMEEIVGDIKDEFDPDVSAIVKNEDGSYSVSGLMLIEEVNGFFGTEIDSGDYDTIGGWIYSHIDFPPVSGQSVYVDGRYAFYIEEMQHLRITRIRIQFADGGLSGAAPNPEHKKGLSGNA